MSEGADDNPQGNVQHIAEYGLDTEDVACVFEAPENDRASKSSGRLTAWGSTPGGTYIIVVYQPTDEGKICVVTAGEVPERKR